MKVKKHIFLTVLFLSLKAFMFFSSQISHKVTGMVFIYQLQLSLGKLLFFPSSYVAHGLSTCWTNSMGTFLLKDQCTYFFVDGMVHPYLKDVA